MPKTKLSLPVYGPNSDWAGPIAILSIDPSLLHPSLLHAHSLIANPDVDGDGATLHPTWKEIRMDFPAELHARGWLIPHAVIELVINRYGHWWFAADVGGGVLTTQRFLFSDLDDDGPSAETRERLEKQVVKLDLI